jgi:hypothetical protein
MMERASYLNIRSQMLPGDVIAFGGQEDFSTLIKLVTRSNVTHIGGLMQARTLKDTVPGRYFNLITESTQMDGIDGVEIHRLSDRLASYKGNVWWLPLGDAARDRLNEQRYFEFLFAQEGKPYDMRQAIMSGVDALDRIPLLKGLTLNREDFARFFCSELIAAALEAGGVLPDINASEMTPGELCRLAIYSGAYFQIAGKERTEIRGYNTMPLERAA